jgi:hypothetical protein
MRDKRRTEGGDLCRMFGPEPPMTGRRTAL